MANSKISRDKVKNTIQSASEEEKEFDQSLAEAKRLELEILKENNRHAKDMLGWIGKIFGYENNAPNNIAFISLLLGFLLAGGCLFTASRFPTDKDFWGKTADSGITFAFGSLTYIFGRNGGKNKDN